MGGFRDGVRWKERCRLDSSAGPAARGAASAGPSAVAAFAFRFFFERAGVASAGGGWGASDAVFSREMALAMSSA